MRSALFSLFLTLVLAGGASSLAFLAGRTTADVAGHYDRGVREGERVGRLQTRAEVGPGSAAYRAAAERARDDGFATGRRAGVTEGRRHGSRSTAPTGFAGGWDPGWYLVALSPTGRGSDAMGVTARVRVRRGTQYALCPRVSRICESRPAARAVTH